jgi:hypothetical protein
MPSYWFIIEDTTYTPKGDSDDSCIVDVEVGENDDEDEAIAAALKKDEMVQAGGCSKNPKDWRKTGTDIHTNPADR